MRVPDRYRQLIEQGLRAAIPAQGPQEHLYDLVREYPRRGGKLLRPALCLAGAALAGGNAEEALGAAVAIELLHNSFLVHDDIEDGSVMRRGEPTLHCKYGLARGVNAGDALAALALCTIADASSSWSAEVARRVLIEFAHLFRRTTEGQAVELGWRVDCRTDVTEADYLSMIRDKTCWYTAIHPLRLGALIGSNGRTSGDDALIAFGFQLGTLFQLHDDLENLLAAPDCYGKDPGADVIEGKITLPIIHYLRSARTADRRELLARLGPQGVGAAEDRHAFVVARLREQGSLDYVARLATSIATCAAHELRSMVGHRRPTIELEFLLGLVVHFHAGCRELVEAAVSGSSLTA